MPVELEKTDHKVRVSTPGGVKAKGTTGEKAEAQARLLRAVEHGWKPTGKPMAKRFKKRHNPGHIPGHESFDSVAEMDQNAPRNFQEFLKQQGE